MKPNLMIVADRPVRARLRAVPDERWQVQVAVGTGRAIDFPAENMRLELFLPPWAGARRSLAPGATQAGARVGVHATFDTAIECRYGLMLTDGSAAMWCLLGGVPLPATNASRDESELRLSIALARAPGALKAIIGPLALPGYRRPAPLERDDSGNSIELAAVNHRPETMLGDDAVDMMLRLSREDVTVYARASATAALWLQLLGGMTSVAGLPSPRRQIMPLDDARTISVPVAIASGHVSVASMSSIMVGDVVRLPTAFDARGHGRLSIGGFEIAVRWRTRTPEHVFEVLDVSSLTVASTAVKSISELDPMTHDDPNSPHHDENHGASREDVDEDDDDENDDEASNEFGDEEFEYAALDARHAESPSAASGAAGRGRADEAAAALVDRLPVTMVAEIGTVTMTLGALRGLQPGVLIKLGSRGHEEVVLRAVDGPPIAYAELVDIGGHLGMQVVRLAST